MEFVSRYRQPRTSVLQAHPSGLVVRPAPCAPALMPPDVRRGTHRAFRRWSRNLRSGSEKARSPSEVTKCLAAKLLLLFAEGGPLGTTLLRVGAKLSSRVSPQFRGELCRVLSVRWFVEGHVGTSMFALQPQAKFKGAISLAWSGGWALGAASAQARGSGFALGEVLALTRLSGSTCPSCLRPGRCPLLVARRGEPLPARRSLFWVSAARRGRHLCPREVRRVQFRADFFGWLVATGVAVPPARPGRRYRWTDRRWIVRQHEAGGRRGRHDRSDRRNRAPHRPRARLLRGRVTLGGRRASTERDMAWRVAYRPHNHDPSRYRRSDTRLLVQPTRAAQPADRP